MPELQVFSSDGKSQKIQLQNTRITVGRSSMAELCYPDDAGLSRQHLAFESDGRTWYVKDLGSKNGTLLNGLRIAERNPLKPGDRIMAGHLIIVFDPSSGIPQHTQAVVFVEPPNETGSSSTLVTDLAGVMGGASAKAEGAAISSATAVQALIRAGNELAGERPLPELFRFILNLAIEAVSAERGILMTLEGQKLEVRATRGEGFRISNTVRDRVLNKKESVLVRDTSADEAFRERRSIVEQNVRTLIAVPLQTRDQIIGLIYVDSPSLTREFTKDDLGMLTVMANVAAIRIEQSRFAELEKARQIMERDLEQAAMIQRQYLPSSAPAVPGLELAGYNAPCRTVGGDYYDFFAYPSGRVALVLGDVSGKGMAASLMMMGLQARVQVLIDEPEDLAATITRLNRITAANCPPARFITLFLCILDGKTGELTYTNAGHNAPLILRNSGAVDSLTDGGPPLGILADFSYHQYRTTLEPGDILAIYSDGVTEAASPDDEEFETVRLSQSIRERRDEPASDIITRVNEDILKWTKGAPAADDVTLILARRLNQPQR
jgi:serine phosphatase RsbU (regulator of sigma subunit)/pSer/pThr/pTyr-binding forkhead associated (FHA) protein